LNATVESKKSKRLGDLLSSILGPVRDVGSVRIVNRNIDLVELEWWYMAETGYTRCSYVVQAKVNGLEDRLKAKLKVVRKGFLRGEVVDFKWKGRELAQVLNGDANLRDTLYRIKHRIPFTGLSAYLEIKPDKKHQRVRIRPIPTEGWAPVSAFPTVETFEAFDRIAHHIRSIANVRQ